MKTLEERLGLPVPATALTAEQEIRARAADSSARLLGPVFAAMVRAAGDDAPDDLIELFFHGWAETTRDAARYIETGTEPVPPQGPAGAADALAPPAA